MNPRVFMIYARAANGTIGHGGALPWHIPADLKRFKALTLGKPMVMGRKTFDSLPGILPGRRHIVLTRRADWQARGADVARSVEDALAIAAREDDAREVAIIGGAEVYDLFRPCAERIEVTEIHADYPGDTFMEPLGPGWEVAAREDHDARSDLPAFSFVTYRRRESGVAQ